MEFNKITKPKIIKTPDTAKELFKGFLFPCNQDKTTKIKKGDSWLYNNKTKKPVIRSINCALCGLDCGQAQLIVVDIDTYKKEFKESKEAQKFFSECLKKSQFHYKTPSGGWHFFFKGSIKSFDPFPGVEIKSQGKYVCLYAHPAPQTDIDNWEEFYNMLPEWDFTNLNKEDNKKREFGAGKNNKAVIQRSGVAGVKASISQGADDIIEMFQKNEGRKDWNKKKDVQDYLENLQKNWTPMPDFIETPTKDKNQQQNQNQKISLSNTIIPPETIKTITPLNFPTGSITIVGGGQGEGKTTTILKAGAHNSSEGDERPMLIFTRENSINNLVLPWWKQFNGADNMLYYPKHPKFPKPEMITWEIAKPVIIEACNSGKFALVFIDLIYLMVRNELENKEYEKALLTIQNNLHFSTAFVATAHLKKDVKDQPLLHHFRGGTDLTGIPDRIMYLRKGKNASQRIIVKLKDRATGDINGGFITTMENKKADIKIDPLSGSPKQILKEHAEALVIEQKTDKTEVLVELIENKIRGYSDVGGIWKTEDYLKWAKEDLKIGENKARALLKQAGWHSDNKGKKGPYKLWPRLAGKP